MNQTLDVLELFHHYTTRLHSHSWLPRTSSEYTFLIFKVNIHRLNTWYVSLRLLSDHLHYSYVSPKSHTP